VTGKADTTHLSGVVTSSLMMPAANHTLILTLVQSISRSIGFIQSLAEIQVLVSLLVKVPGEKKSITSDLMHLLALLVMKSILKSSFPISTLGMPWKNFIRLKTLSLTWCKSVNSEWSVLITSL
jgi:hypothetical protein